MRLSLLFKFYVDICPPNAILKMDAYRMDLDPLAFFDDDTTPFSCSAAGPKNC